MTTEGKYPKHNKTHFYKYTDIETACLILQNKTWRWSSPSQFNDPFDVQSTLCFDCEEDVFRETLCKEIEEIVLSKKQVDFKYIEGIGEAIVVLRDKYLRQDCTKEYVRAIIKIMVDAYGNLREKFRGQYFQWLQEKLPYLRVFCVSEVRDSILMWSHYADYHKGVVFKLKVLHGKDITLCDAGRVIYDKNPFIFFTTQEWIDDFIGIDEVGRKADDKYIYHKNKIWYYEKEWRVWFEVTEKAEQEFTYCNVYPEEIEAVYFGCNTSGGNRTKIMKLAREVNPKVAFFQGSKDQDGFGIVFDRI